MQTGNSAAGNDDTDNRDADCGMYSHVYEEAKEMDKLLYGHYVQVIDKQEINCPNLLKSDYPNNPLSCPVYEAMKININLIKRIYFIYK